MRSLLIATILFHTILNASANEPVITHKVKCNMTVQYKKKPKKVDNISDFFTEGIFYGRIRINNFEFQDKKNNQEYFISGFGGSVVYKTAYLNGVGLTTGLYSSQNMGDTDQDLADDYRAGKDVLNRYELATNNNYGMISLAQIYLEYKNHKNQLKIGRFPLETALLKSNDTKMIPNTFEGLYYKTRSIPKTTIQTAYLRKQKLRDHTKFHHVFAYGDREDDPYAKWTQNDDGGMHRGITASKLAKRGIEDKIMLVEIRNQSIEELTLKASYTHLPELLSSIILDSTYIIDFDELKVIPSLRYMQQFDLGAGEIGGANLRNNTVAYNNSDSLKGSLLAGRIDIIKEAASLRLGYSKVADKSDIVAPWRGFPTAGYTRAMSQTNWYANTESYMIRMDYDFSKTDFLPGWRAMMRYAINDFDDNKAGVQADNRVLTFDIVKRFKSIPNFHTKLRTAFVKGDSHTIAGDNSIKKDPSYNEVRLEFNYLF